jgi:arginase
MQTVHLIGAPLDLGGNRRGTDMGPSAFRIAGIADHLSALGVTVVDKGDISTPIPEVKGPGDPHKRYVRDIAKVCLCLYQTALASLDDGALPIVLGGDHSLGAGSVAASAAFVGQEPLELARFHGDGPAVLAKHTVLVGIRNLDDVEKKIVKASQVAVFTMKDVDRLGITEVMERALVIAGRGTGGIHVSFDLDVCDPAIAPGVGTPVKGGLDYREAHVVMEMAAESKKLLALDLVEVNPTLDMRNTTAELGVELALSALGKQIL